MAHLGGDLYRAGPGLAARNTEIVPITPAISARAAELVDTLALSHGMRLADALISATALENQATLVTANVKHFSAVHGLVVEALLP